ncbi:MAG: phospholipase A1 [Oleiphilaceae bacterium]|jgi:phospholipase A1
MVGIILMIVRKTPIGRRLKVTQSIFLGFCLCLLGFSAKALEEQNCFLNVAASSSPETTIAKIAEQCLQEKGNFTPKRILKEKASEQNNFVITPHHQNYILPFTHNDSQNQDPLESQGTYGEINSPLQHKEAKLQISFKVPLNEYDIFFPNDGFYIGFTMKSFWQVYNTKLSAPFRETNYRPEVFYQAPISSQALGGAWIARLGFEHESNGRSQLLSRSWNRVFVGVGFLKDRWALYLQPWYRLPEDTKEDDGDPNTPISPKGDDNPDIEDFLGHYEFLGVYNAQNYEFTNMVRHNFDTGKGSIELGVSFPLWGRLKGFVQYYNGYGESLIDYDHRVQRVGLGLLLTDLL